ncbi:uncharacterized protein C17orf50 homolog [Spea bombifrons]|uniref:uncharacterized protein C17orf50 homolog n=1 Tax=Spea bombifrons TaxID=233779 RepID=UPI00234B0ED7|nr:uncharacterized protein C17orf50 homolog [Spea bombifrons]
MSLQNKKPSEKDKEMTSTPDSSVRKKRDRLIRKKIYSFALLCGSIKTQKVKKRVPEEKRKPQRRVGQKDPKVTHQESCCGRMERPRRMCPKCEIVSCRKCDTLHADTLFVAHSLLDHYDI